MEFEADPKKATLIGGKKILSFFKKRFASFKPNAIFAVPYAKAFQKGNKKTEKIAIHFDLIVQFWTEEK